jgi:cytochrome c biogenesis protein CcdA
MESFQNTEPTMTNPLDTPLAFLAGLLTIASPCVLPMLPILLGSGVNQRNRRRPLFIVAGFILSFASFAMLLGVVSATIEVAQEVLRNTAIALLALSGLFRLWPAPYEWLLARLPNRNASAAPRADDGSNGGAFLLGVSLGAVWTPCAGPVLASILVLVVKAQDPAWSALLLTLYAIGAAVPMLGIIYGGQYATQRVRSVARHAERLQQVFGVLVIATAIAIYLQYDTLAYSWAAQHLPTLKGL